MVLWRQKLGGGDSNSCLWTQRPSIKLSELVCLSFINIVITIFYFITMCQLEYKMLVRRVIVDE